MRAIVSWPPYRDHPSPQYVAVRYSCHCCLALASLPLQLNQPHLVLRPSAGNQPVGARTISHLNPSLHPYVHTRDPLPVFTIQNWYCHPRYVCLPVRIRRSYGSCVLCTYESFCVLDKMTRVCFRLMFPDKQVTISILEKKIHSLWGAHSWSRGKSAKVGVEKERCKIHPDTS